MWEGSEFIRFIQNELFLQRVVDFKCGTGRLAWLFNPLNYTGVDDDPAMIAWAREEHPAHEFKLIEHGKPIVGYDVALAHDVFGKDTHLDIEAGVKMFTQPRVIVSEILSRYQLEDYSRAFGSNGYRFHRVVMQPSPDGREIVAMEFHRT